MPANLTPQYFDAEKKYKAAKTTQEKLMYLQEMLAIIPKHKGTEKLQADIKSRISKLKDQVEHQKKSGGPSNAWYQVDKQGAGQVVLSGAPNSGKSALLNALTNTNVEVAEYPFTTANPQVGMMKYEDILIQIVDTPPLTESSPPWLYALYRSADLLLILVDAADDDLLFKFEIQQKLLADHALALEGTEPNKPNSMILLTRLDLGSGAENARIFREMHQHRFPVYEIAVNRKDPLELLKKDIFLRLNIIRVYTKKIGQPPVKREPVILKSGTTVIEAAEHIHKDFRYNLQFTRLWNDNGFSGQRVEKTYILKDGDIIEFHV